MSRLKIALPTTLLLGGFLSVALMSSVSYGTAEYTKQTKKTCNYCHVQNPPKKGDPKATELKDAGKYFKEHKSFDGYVEKK